MTLYELVIADRDHKIIEFGKKNTLEQKIEWSIKNSRYIGMLSLFAAMEQHYPELYEQVKNIDADLVLNILQLTLKGNTGDTQRL